MVFPSLLNTMKADDRCVNGWSVPVGVLMVVMCNYRVHWHTKYLSQLLHNSLEKCLFLVVERFV